jgi:hypothetical protein
MRANAVVAIYSSKYSSKLLNGSTDKSTFEEGDFMKDI